MRVRMSKNFQVSCPLEAPLTSQFAYSLRMMVTVVGAGKIRCEDASHGVACPESGSVLDDVGCQEGVEAAKLITVMNDKRQSPTIQLRY